MRTTKVMGAVAVAAAVVFGMASPASARFSVHNGADVTQTDVVASSEYNTCGDKISGISGWGTTSTLEQLGGSLPPEATGNAKYEVFLFTGGRGPADAQVTFNDDGTTTYNYSSDGSVVPRVAAFDGPTRVALATPIQQVSDDGSGTILYIYSEAPFAQTISPAAPVGSKLAIKPLGGAAFRVLDVVTCSTTPPPPPPPVTVTAKIDAQPGLSPNYVIPSSGAPTLAILVKGSATLDVTKISTAKVGAAGPVTSGLFGLLGKPYDIDRDGKADRLYFFKPNQAGLTCSSTSVTIAGTLQGGSTWSGTDSVKPVFC